MKRLNASLWIAGGAAVYWSAFYIFVFLDLYLTYDAAGLLIKMLAPIAFLGNALGVALALSALEKRRGLAWGAVLLNLTPILSATCFVFWLFCGVRY